MAKPEFWTRTLMTGVRVGAKTALCENARSTEPSAATDLVRICTVLHGEIGDLLEFISPEENI